MSNKSVIRGAIAWAAGLTLLAVTGASASPGQQRGSATQMTREDASRSTSSTSAQQVQRNGPGQARSNQNPRTTAREPRSSARDSGRHHVDRNAGRSGARSDRGQHGRHYDRRHHDRRHYDGRRYYRGHRYSSHYNYYYPRSPFYWYGFYYPFYYGHYAYGYPYGRYDRYRYSSREAYGALDLDVKPEKAEVFIDGRFVGVADNFDGFPSYLWLEPGTYEVAFYKEGYETVTREVKVSPDAVIDFKDAMVRGSAVKPEPPPEEPRTATTGDRETERKMDEWRERAREYMARKDEPKASDTLDARGEPGRLFLVVRPGDASVYLDGRFLGTGDELSRLHSGLMVDPGEHELEVVRPGYGSESKTFSVEAGEEVDLSLRLKGLENAA